MHPAEALAQQLKPGRGWDQWLADEFRENGLEEHIRANGFGGARLAKHPWIIPE